MKTKTLISSFHDILGDRVPTRVKHALELKHRVLKGNTSDSIDDVEYVWENKFLYLEDVKKKDFLKGRNTGERTWKEFEIIRDEFFIEIKTQSLLLSQGVDDKSHPLPSTIERIKQLYNLYDKDKITLGTVAALIILFADFTEKQLKLTQFLPFKEGDWKKGLIDFPEDNYYTKKQAEEQERHEEDYHQELEAVIFSGFIDFKKCSENYYTLINVDHTKNLIFGKTDEMLYWTIGGTPIRTIDELAMGNPHNGAKFEITSNAAIDLKLIQK